MTVPIERTRAVIQTQEFLTELIDPKKTPRVPKRYRDIALHLLRHYPTAFDLKLTAAGYGEKIVSFVQECPFADPDEKF